MKIGFYGRKVMNKNGSLCCVGLGITLGAHLTPAALHKIKNADVVYVAASSGIVEKWVETLNSNVKSLQPFYNEVSSRKETYKQMSEVMIKEMRLGKKVVGAFYGHPSVFALAPRVAVAQALKEGYKAYIEPGISAEACLYADLLLDPGRTGCQQFETTQFMRYQRKVDTASLLILWQVGLAGDYDSKAFSTTPAKLQALLKKLVIFYPPEHEIIIYEAKVLPSDRVRKEKIMLSELSKAELSMISTLIVPPNKRLIDIKDKAMLNMD